MSQALLTQARPALAFSIPPTAGRLSTRPSWSLPGLAVVLAVWLASVGNLALWRQLMALPEVTGGRGVLFGLGFGVWVAAVLTALLSLLAWPRVFKVAATVMLLMAAAATHFMLAYSAVIDPSMIVNVLHTDAREVVDLLSPGLVITLFGVGVMPAWWVWRQSLTPTTWQRKLGATSFFC
jgi:lipid A ethanolaminephosphotransferase